VSSDRKIPKSAVRAEIVLADGSILNGNLFAPNLGRITDLLNDDRKFLPVQTLEGQFVAVAKSAIQTVSLRSAEQQAYRGKDPWRILGVEQGISVEELKHVYRQLCGMHHPDRIKGLGLGRDYEDLATRNMARINDAYDQVMKIMGAAVTA
jgi:hypothetical protein